MYNAKVDPGELMADEVTLYEVEYEYVNGQAEEVMLKQYILPTKFRTQPSKEAVSSGRLGSTVLATFIVYQVEDFSDTTRWHILYQGKKYNIKNWHIMDGFYCQLTAELYQ